VVGSLAGAGSVVSRERDEPWWRKLLDEDVVPIGLGDCFERVVASEFWWR
jgi:hypothetical protein